MNNVSSKYMTSYLHHLRYFFTGKLQWRHPGTLTYSVINILTDNCRSRVVSVHKDSGRTSDALQLHSLTGSLFSSTVEYCCTQQFCTVWVNPLIDKSMDIEPTFSVQMLVVKLIAALALARSWLLTSALVTLQLEERILNTFGLRMVGYVFSGGCTQLALLLQISKSDLKVNNMLASACDHVRLLSCWTQCMCKVIGSNKTEGVCWTASCRSEPFTLINGTIPISELSISASLVKIGPNLSRHIFRIVAGKLQVTVMGHMCEILPATGRILP